MSEEVSPEVIQSTQKLLGRYVTKPQLSEKLLKKPPFRFLHDIITALIRDTSFLKGLYTEAELNSDNVKDRDAKIAFLTKLITAVKTISGKDLQARPNKIIAGLDASETNRLLQTIAKLVDDKVDTKEYVKSTKKSSKDLPSSKEPSNVKKASSKTSVASKSNEKLDSSRIAKKATTEKKQTTRKNSQEISPKVKDSLTPKTKSDLKKKDRSSVNSKDTKTSKNSTVKVSKKDDTKKVSPKVKAIPASTPKTPKTPTSVDDTVKESPKAEESASQDVKNTEVKEESPRENENSWKPQVIDEDTQKEVEKALEEKTEVVNEDVNVIESVVKKDDGLPSYEEAKVSVEEPPAPVVRQPSARPKSARPRSGNNEQQALLAAQNKIKSEKPPSADKRKAEVKPIMPVKEFSLKDSINEVAVDKENLESAPSEIIKDIQEVKKPVPFRPKSSMLRPPSVRPSSARPGAPRLRPESSLPMKEVVPLGKINVIIENFDAKDDVKNDEDEEETVVIQSVQEDVPEVKFAEKNFNLDIPADKGHLVETILEQMQDGGQVDKAQLEWEHEGSRGKDATTKEINALRASIQSLTRTANPLGKLASYLHEDVEAMHSELETWLNMKGQYTLEIAKQKRVNNESNQPLLKQLQNLEENIKREREEIANVKYNILRNEERIRQLVSKQIALE